MEITLGYDQSCTSCSGIAATIREATDGELAIAPLSDPLFGDNNGRTPLLRVKDQDRVRVYRGPAIPLLLARHLGIRRAWRVSQALGEHRFGKPKTASGLDRRGFILGVVGTAFGFWTVSSTAFASQNGGGASASATADMPPWVRIAVADDATVTALPQAFATASSSTLVSGSLRQAVAPRVMGALGIAEDEATAQLRDSAIAARHSSSLGIVEATAVQLAGLVMVQYSWPHEDGTGSSYSLAYGADPDQLTLIATQAEGAEATAAKCINDCSGSSCTNPVEYCGTICCVYRTDCLESWCPYCLTVCANPIACYVCMVAYCLGVGTLYCCDGTKRACIPA